MGYYQTELKVNQRLILKSTRQKNWLSIPGKKCVTFHKSVISKKIKAEKREVTMVKSDKLDKVKRSGISPFLYTPEEFPEDQLTQNIETTENGSKLKSKMRVLEDNEQPEQYTIWLKDYEDKILANKVLKAPAKLAILRTLIDEEAQTILCKVENDYNQRYAEPEDVDLLFDYKLREEVCTKYTTDAEVRVYFGDAGPAVVKIVRVEHIIREALHRLKIQIFGKEKFGLQSFIQLKRTMTSMKIGNGVKIQQWSKRYNTFQDYLPRCLWVAGAKQGLWPEAYDKERKKEILEFALSKDYITKLNSEGWCLMENTYDQSIHRITEIEPDILKMIRETKEKRERDVAIKELQEKIGLATTAEKKERNKNKYGNRDKNRSTSKADGPKDGNEYYLCGNCGNIHRGVCRKPKGSTTDHNTTPRKDWKRRDGHRPNATTRNYIKQMISSDSKKRRKGKGKRRYTSDSSSDESSSDGSSRRSGMSRAEQMHMLASAGINPNNSDIEFDSEDEKRYKKQAKKWSKSMSKRRRR